MNVKLARAFAESGVATFRFDLSGQGDSRSSVQAHDFSVQAVCDIQSAMDHVEATIGCRRFALIGICSGAIHSLDVATRDARVTGALLFDGQSYPTPLTAIVWHWKRFRATPWGAIVAAAGRRVSRAFGAGWRSSPERRPQSRLASPPRREFVAQLRMLVDRGVELLFVYGGSGLEQYSYRRQFEHAFGRESLSSKVRAEYHPDIDHTFVSLAAQRKFVELACKWVVSMKRLHEP